MITLARVHICTSYHTANVPSVQDMRLVPAHSRSPTETMGAPVQDMRLVPAHSRSPTETMGTPVQDMRLVPAHSRSPSSSTLKVTN